MQSKIFRFFLIIGVAFTNSLSGQSDTISFDLTDHNNIVIKVLMNDVDSVSLMFHTDATGITLIESSTQQMNSISWDGEGTALSWGGQHSSRVSQNNTCQIGTMKWDSLMVFEDQRSGPGTDGKFGPDLFEGKVIEVNFDQKVIVLSDSLKDGVERYEKCPLTSENGSLFIEGVTLLDDAFPHKFLIHTGFGGTLLYDDEFVQQTKLGSAIEITEEQDLKDSFGNVIKTRKGVLPIFSIGSITFENVVVGFFDGAVGKQRMSIIGGGLLKQINFIIDAERENIYIVKSLM